MKTIQSIFMAALAMLLATSSALGQYYSKDIFLNPDQLTNWGEVMNYGNKDNVITGFTTFTTPFVSKKMAVTRTDPNGNVIWANAYALNNGFNRFKVLSCYGAQVGALRIGLGGIIQDSLSTNTAVYYSSIRMNGAVYNAMAYFDSLYVDYQVHGIYNDLINGQFFIMGSARKLALNRRVGFILSVVPTTGAINWGRTYDLAIGTALDTRVYDAVYNTQMQELVVVGSVGTPNQNDAFIMTVNAFNGQAFGGIGTPVMMGNPASDDAFTSVDFVNSNGDTCLIISGYSNTRGNYDAWAVRGNFQMTPATILSYLYDHNGANYNNVGKHIIRRVNGAGNNTFFLGGDVVVPTGVGTTQTDLDIYKLDNLLNTLANFTEGTPSTNDRLSQLGNYDGSTGFAMGLMAYTTKIYTSAAWNDFHLDKFYFSGHIPCDGGFYAPQRWAGPPSFPGKGIDTTAFYNVVINCVKENNLNNAFLCNGTVVGGSNAKRAPGLAFESVGGTRDRLQVRVDNPSLGDTPAEILVSDMMGRVWLQQSVQISSGEQTLELPSNLQGQAAGIYLITLRSAEGTSTKRIFLD